MSKPTRKSRRISIFWVLLPLYTLLLIVFAALIKHGKMQLLQPAGYIAGIQSRILWGALIFAGIMAALIISTVFYVVFHYKEGANRRYDPSWKASRRLQLAAWGIPFLAIAVISLVDWNTAHLVDPYRQINSAKTPITIQVVALRWKWLFLYPNERIASVNQMEIPTDTPISLQLTADAPMNSFWVPSLSGQIYAMPGMVTQLHVQANKTGEYPGSAAEISGDGFAGMDFTVKAVTPADFVAWKMSLKSAPQTLDYASYVNLAKPSSYNQPATYVLREPNLFQTIVMQYMVPTNTGSSTQNAGY